MYCDTNQFPSLPFYGLHSNPRGARELGKHYNICFGPNIGHGICATFHIPCACVACTLMLDQPWISSFQSTNHVQDNSDVERKYVKMYCDTNQFPSLPFYGLHSNPRGYNALCK